MRILSTLTLFLPVMAVAEDTRWVEEYAERMYPTKPQQQVYGVPVQPVLPVPQDQGPWGTGYSIVTSTRPTRNLWDRDVTGSETVQRVVPNDALGQPMKGLDLNNW